MDSYGVFTKHKTVSECVSPVVLRRTDGSYFTITYFYSNFFELTVSTCNRVHPVVYAIVVTIILFGGFGFLFRFQFFFFGGIHAHFYLICLHFILCFSPMFYK